MTDDNARSPDAGQAGHDDDASRPVWAPPAYGGSATPPSAGGYANPQDDAWTAPNSAGQPYGTYSGYQGSGYGGYGQYGQPGQPAFSDNLSSPPPSRRGRIGMIAGVIVVVALLVAGGVTAFTGANRSNHQGAPTTGTADTAAPSASAFPNNSEPGEPAPAPAASGPLDSYLLEPSDLGRNTFMALINGGRDATNQATLDFCNYSYSSEKLRTQRVQVEYLGGAQRASNEFVRYQPGGAAKAYTEIQKAVTGCPSSFQEYGGQVSHIERLTTMSGLVPEHLVVTYSETSSNFAGTATTSWSTIVYQFDGDFFSGVYVYGTDKQAVQQEAAKLGTYAAKHLAEAVAGKPGTGGGPILGASQPAGGGVQT